MTRGMNRPREATRISHHRFCCVGAAISNAGASAKRKMEVAMIGASVNRIDGARKVTGRAVYSYERHEAGRAFYSFILGATIGKGRVVRIDTSEAANAPGIKLVMTHRNAPERGP